MHVCRHDIVVAILTAQDMRVAYAAALANAVRSDYGSVAVQRIPVLCVLAHREAQLLHQVLIAPSLEIGEKVAGELLFVLGLHCKCQP